MGEPLMATNLVYRNDDANNRVEDLGLTLAPGEPVLSTAGLPAVTVTASAIAHASPTRESIGRSLAESE